MSIAIEARMSYAARGRNAIICVRESTFRGPHQVDAFHPFLDKHQAAAWTGCTSSMLRLKREIMF